MIKTKKILLSLIAFVFLTTSVFALDREESRKKEMEQFQKKFEWWPTDAKPGPVKDAKKGGYWWWPTKPGEIGPLWGNRGWVYVYKIIFDYKEDELPPPKPKEPRPSLLIRKMIRNVKIYFDFDKADLREDAIKVLKNAIDTLRRNPESSILITGNCDVRGSEAYNVKLGKRRGEAVKEFMLENGVPEERIKIVSRGKLDAIAPVTDILGMQKDRNAQFMIAEVQEVMIPYPEDLENMEAELLEDGKYLIEEKESVESAVKVSTKEYIVKKGDTLSGIAQREYGGAYKWKYLYELNKSRIKNPNKLEVGQKIIIPVE
ncbi:MAG: OmpA family protein [Candidatus Omnitrophica bacterium]|nr:OmpA family protein [Candidatus Omnitrophota bacterium]MBU4488186.1 OmpA family protein [Candidatus Omnitrophota bacterium]MCG2705410.1 OmpA family protein [Candidatus Omnitrophota bacterium]